MFAEAFEGYVDRLTTDVAGALDAYKRGVLSEYEIAEWKKLLAIADSVLVEVIVKHRGKEGQTK